MEAGLWASRQAVDKRLQEEGLEWRVHASGTGVNGIKLFLSLQRCWRVKLKQRGHCSAGCSAVQ